IYHRLYAVTDLNNPLFSPDNIPSSFRSVARETGVIANLLAAQDAGRKFTIASIAKLVFTSLGYGPYAEDDEGVISPQTVDAAALTDWSGVLGGLLSASASQSSCGAKKIFVCHKNKNTLCVGSPAREAHIGHGDTTGVCTGSSALSN